MFILHSGHVNSTYFLRKMDGSITSSTLNLDLHEAQYLGGLTNRVSPPVRIVGLPDSWLGDG